MPGWRSWAQHETGREGVSRLCGFGPAVPGGSVKLLVNPMRAGYQEAGRCGRSQPPSAPALESLGPCCKSFSSSSSPDPGVCVHPSTRAPLSKHWSPALQSRAASAPRRQRRVVPSPLTLALPAWAGDHYASRAGVSGLTRLPVPTSRRKCPQATPAVPRIRENGPAPDSGPRVGILLPACSARALGQHWRRRVASSQLHHRGTCLFGQRGVSRPWLPLSAPA